MWAKHRQKHNAVRGEKVFCAKLTEKKVIEIKAANEDWIILAKKYGVSVWTIHNIKCGQTWKWVKSAVGGSQNKSAGGTTLPPVGLLT